MEYESFFELVKKRRSIRNFKPDPIPEGHVEKIIEAACWSPSGFNMQPWEFVVVKKQKLKDSIANIYTLTDEINNDTQNMKSAISNLSGQAQILKQLISFFEVSCKTQDPYTRCIDETLNPGLAVSDTNKAL